MTALRLVLPKARALAGARSLSALVCASLATQGCFTAPAEQVTLAVPRPAGPAEVTREDRPGPLELSAVVDGATLDVTATHTTSCRKVTTTPMVQDVDTKRSAPRLATVGNAIGAAVFIGGGAVAIPTTDGPVQTGIGIALCAIGVVFVAALVSNSVRAKDAHETVPSRPRREGGDFARCEGKPATGTDLTVQIGPSILRGTTADGGHARFDLSGVAPTADLVASPVAHVHEGYGPATLDVDLSGTPLFGQWKTAVDDASARDAARQREDDARKKRLERAERQQIHR